MANELRVPHDAFMKGAYIGEEQLRDFLRDHNQKNDDDVWTAAVVDCTLTLQAELVALRGEKERLQKLLDAYNSSGFADSDAMAAAYLDMRERAEAAEAQLVAREAPEDAWKRALTLATSQLVRSDKFTTDWLSTPYVAPAKLAPSDDKEQQQ